MSLDKFNSYAKQQMDQHPIVVDADAMWAKVQNDLHPKKDRKILWFLLCLGGLVLALGYTFFPWNKNASLIDISKPATASITTGASLVNKSIAAKNQFNSPPEESSNTFTTTANGKERVEQMVGEIISKPINIKSSLINNVQNKDTETIGTQIQKEIIANNITIKKASSNSYIKEHQRRLKEVVKTPLLKTSYVTSILHNDEGIQNLAQVKPVEIESLKKKHLRVGIHLNTGLAFTNTSLSTNNNERVQLLETRAQAETDLETIDIGLGILLKHNSGTYLNLGASYRRSSTRLMFDTEVIALDTIATRFIVNQISLDTIFLNNALTQEITTTKSNTIFNELQVVNIPIQIGYNYRINKWLLDIEAGALFNIYVKRNGHLADGTLSFYDLDIDSFNWFREKLDISFQGSFKLGYKFNDSLEILGGPFITSPVILNESINPIRQTQFNIGLQLSTRYWW